jgi:hypothetical protein
MSERKENKKNELALPSKSIFDDLNKTIEKIGERGSVLSPKEKEIGFKVLQEWEENVIRKLNDKKSDCEAFFSIIEHYHSEWYGRESDGAMREKLAMMSETEKEYTEILLLEEEYDLQKLKRPREPGIDSSLTIIENDRRNYQWKKQNFEFEIELRKLGENLERKRNAWLKIVREHGSVKEMILSIRGFKRNFNELISTAKAKATNAKLNLSISDKSMREAMQELVDFAEMVL